jgi:hypothetical protein
MRKPEQFSVLLPSTAGFERALPVQGAICCCPSRSQAQSWPRSREHLANVGLNEQTLIME